MNRQKQNNDIDVVEHKLDPFPQPRTLPEGWDLSELFASQDCQSLNCQTVVDVTGAVKQYP